MRELSALSRNVGGWNAIGRKPERRATDSLIVNAVDLRINLSTTRGSLYYNDRNANLSMATRKRRAAVKNLLHMSLMNNTRTDTEHRAACDAISAFFADKLRKITESPKAKLVGAVINPFAYDSCHRGPPLTSLSVVMAEEVQKHIDDDVKILVIVLRADVAR